jgi:hypothetical protein
MLQRASSCGRSQPGMADFKVKNPRFTGMWRCASVLLATAGDFRAAIAQWSSHAQGNATIGTKMILIA